ncbi:pyridoxal phosphate-dependent aminotransferase [Ekhidna sp.]
METINKSVYYKLKELKDNAGTHSPSINTILENIPEIDLRIDACYLSNPYATDLFISHFDSDLVKSNKLREVLEFYPSQNNNISYKLGDFLDIDHENIFIGNGAVEIIQAVIHNFSKRIIVNIPTFSSYYEFAKPDQEVIFYQLDKNDNYRLDIEDYIQFVKEKKPDTVVIINPNNPDGSYLTSEEMEVLVKELKDVKNLIIDESFIHFAYEEDSLQMIKAVDFFRENKNVIVIKSMSKDFGIAGIRAGYAIMPLEKRNYLLENGFLWNSNGLAEYFFQLYVNKNFQLEYDEVRRRYIRDTQKFYQDLLVLPGIKVYPTKANFVLIELLNGMSSFEFVSKLLIEYGIYVRTCDDKIGLEGQFLRIGSRTFEENEQIVSSLQSILTI